MLRTVKPKNARSKRALKAREPKRVENPKKALFVPGVGSNKFLHDLTTDLLALKKPLGTRFQRKNDVLPFEDASKLERFAEKNDCSLMILTSSSKKRPNTLTCIRTFNFQIYDMIELHVISCKLIQSFRKTTIQVGLKPMFTFNGSVFETNPTYKRIKSFFLDFYRGVETTLLDPEALQHVISISAEEVDENSDILPPVYFRVYLLKTERSSMPKVPRVELEEIGPSIDFKVGRIRLPSPELEKEAFKRADLDGKTKKNVDRDSMGDQLGRIHMNRQDFDKLQTRKMKGLKRKYDEAEEDKQDENASEISESNSEFEGLSD